MFRSLRKSGGAARPLLVLALIGQILGGWPLVALPHNSFDEDGACSAGDTKNPLAIAWHRTVSLPAGHLYAVLGGDSLILGGSDFALCLQRDTGRVLWRQSMESEPVVAPVQCGRSWLLAVTSRDVSALDSGTGQAIWSKKLPAPIKFLTGDGNHVMVVGSDSTISMLESATGNVFWQKKSAAPLSIPPVFAGDGWLIVARGSGLVGYHSHDGEEIWNREIGSNPLQPLAAWGEDLFAVTRDHTVWSLNVQTGEVRWKCSPSDVSLLPPTDVKIVAVTSNHLFICSHRGRLCAVSRRTGELRAVHDLSRALAIDPLVEPRAVIFLTQNGLLSLAAFDTQSELIFNQPSLPRDNTVLAVEGAQMLLLRTGGQLALACARYQPPDPYREGFAGDENPWPGVVLTAAIVLTLLVGALTFATAGRPRIPSTQMTSLLLLALLTCVGVLCVITARMGWLILKQDAARSSATVGVALALFAPTFCLCIGHLAVWWQARPRSRDRGKPVGNPESLKVVQRLARDMELPADAVERIDEAGDGPFVLGVSRRRFKLILPSDLHDRALRACGGDKQLAAGLMRLVIAHELAHVRNGDVRFLPLLTTIRLVFPWCFAVIVTCSLLAGAFATQDLATSLARGMVGIMTVGGVSLWVLLKLALRERERLADATATLFVSPGLLTRLTRTTHDHETPPPPLEAFLVGLRVRRALRKRVLGFDANTAATARPWQRWWMRLRRETNTLAGFQREQADRSYALLQKQHAVGEPPASNWQAAVAAGIIAGLLLGAFAHFVAGDFFARLLEFRGDPANPLTAGFLKAYPVWSHEQDQSVGWKVARTLAPLVSGMLLAGTALLPWRDVARKARVTGHCALTSGLAALLLALIIAGFVFELTTPSHFPFPSFPMLRVSDLGLWLWSATAALLFATLLILRSFTRRTREILLEACFILVLVAAGGLVCWLLLEGLSGAARLVWILALILVPSLLLLTGPLRRFVVQEDYREESIRFVRILWFTRMFCNRLGGDVGLSRQFLLWLSTYAITVFCLPAWLLAIPVRHTLMKLDANRFELARTRGVEMARLMEDAPNRIRANRSAFASQFFPLLVQRRILAPAGPRPSTWLGVGALTCACVLGFGVFGARALLVRKKAKRALASAGPMAELLERLRLPMMQRWFGPRLDAALKGVGSYVTSETGVPLLLRTCRVLECVAHLAPGDNRQLQMLAWLLQCRMPRGGFGPDRQPTLQHTVAALRTLRRLSASTGFDPSLHEHWLRRILVECWRKRFTMPPSSWLEGVGLTLEGLEQIAGAFPRLARLKRLGRGFVEAGFRIWQASEQSTQDTKHLAEVFSLWQHAARAASAGLQQAWLTSWEIQLATLHPETELKELADSVTLLSRLFPLGYAKRASVVQVADNLEKCWRHAK